jgi:HD superfamily phosphohydrolase YqeK
MIQMKITIRSTDNSFTNAINVHTCPTCNMNLIRPIVLVVDDELAEFTRDVVRRAGVGVPSRTHGWRCSRSSL